MRVKTGELTPKAAREMAVMVGDMPRWLKEEVDKEEEENKKEQNQAGSEFGPDQLSEGIVTEIGENHRGWTWRGKTITENYFYLSS